MPGDGGQPWSEVKYSVGTYGGESNAKLRAVEGGDVCDELRHLRSADTEYQSPVSWCTDGPKSVDRTIEEGQAEDARPLET